MTGSIIARILYEDFGIKINVHQPLSRNAVYTFTRTSRQGNVILSNRQECSSLDVGSEDYIQNWHFGQPLTVPHLEGDSECLTGGRKPVYHHPSRIEVYKQAKRRECTNASSLQEQRRIYLFSFAGCFLKLGVPDGRIYGFEKLIRCVFHARNIDEIDFSAKANFMTF